MADQSQDDRAFFADQPLRDDDELITLHEARFIGQIQQWKQYETLADLRVAVLSFRADLMQSIAVPPAMPPHEDLLSLSRAYLFGELDQISEALTLERANYYLDRLLKGVTHIRTTQVNDINLNRWKTYEDIQTDSLWLVDRRDGSGVHTAGYWGNFIPQIPNQMMRRYTKRGEWVLDTFAGSGTTLIEGQRLGRNTLGIELQPRMVEHAKGLVAAEPNPHRVTIDVVQGNCAAIDYRELLERYQQSAVQLAIMHPPYFDIIKFSDDPDDMSNAESVDHFLAMIGQAVEQVAAVLDKGRYLVLVMGDKYSRGDWIPLGFQAMNVVLQYGFSLKSIVVKNFEETSGKRAQKELWRYRALVGGFYVFKHEYIFLFRKK
jgi:hypothetical protein